MTRLLSIRSSPQPDCGSGLPSVYVHLRGQNLPCSQSRDCAECTSETLLLHLLSNGAIWVLISSGTECFPSACTAPLVFAQDLGASPIPRRSAECSLCPTSPCSTGPLCLSAVGKELDFNLYMYASQDPQSLHGGLVALRILTRKYEFRTEDDKGPLLEIVDASFTLVLQLFQVSNSAWTLTEPLILAICRSPGLAS